MPTEVLPIGMPWTMVANQVYALPPLAVTLYTDAAAPTITQSGTQAFTANTSVTLSGGAADVVGPFIKATSNVLVTLKRK